MNRPLLCLLALAGCDDRDCCAFEDAGIPFVEIVAVPVTPNHDIDMLFVLDDSTGGLEMQGGVRDGFVPFLATLAELDGGLPNLHLGVISTDVGTLASSGAIGGAIGSGPGSCAGTGKDGALLTDAAVLVDGPYIIDVETPGGGPRTTNYSIGLVDAFWQATSLGAAGCGFEQPLHALRRALDNHPANAGFLRAGANLAIVIVTDEDDCSFTDPALVDPAATELGPLQSFRCTRFGIACDGGGATPDAMALIGDKTDCRANEASPYVDAVAPYASFVRGTKASPYQVLVAAIAGAADPVRVEERTPPGGGAPVPALAHTCTAQTASGLEVADPGVRLRDFATLFPRHVVAGDVCTDDYRDSFTAIAWQLRNMVGDPCLGRPLPAGAACVAYDVRGDTETVLPGCEGPITTDCFRLVPDVAHCSAEQHLELEVERSVPPPPDTVVSLRCRL